MITVTLKYDAFTGRSIYDLIKAIVPKAFVGANLSNFFDPYCQRDIRMTTFEEWEDLIIALDEVGCDYEIVDFKEDGEALKVLKT